MAEIEGQVDAVSSLDGEQWLVVFDVHCDELVADFRRVLCCVCKTELRGLHFLVNVRVLCKINLVRLYAFGPPNVV